MDITFIKEAINQAFHKANYHFTYNDLFKILDQESGAPRVRNRTKHQFIKELERYLKSGEDFIIYIQCDDAPYLGAECDGKEDILWYEIFEDTPELQNSIYFSSFTNGNQKIYISID